MSSNYFDSMASKFMSAISNNGNKADFNKYMSEVKEEIDEHMFIQVILIVLCISSFLISLMIIEGYR